VSDPAASTYALAARCVETGSEDAWVEFCNGSYRLIARTVLRTARRWSAYYADSADDLVQEVYLKLCADGCRVLRQFDPSQALFFEAYLKATATNVVHDHFKALHARKRGAGLRQHSLTDVEVCQPAVGFGSQAQMDREIFLHQVANHLHRCLPAENRDRDLTIFWLTFRQGLSSKAIASLPAIALTTKGVESAQKRVADLLRSEFVDGAQPDVKVNAAPEVNAP